MADQQASRDHDLRLALADLLKKKMLQSVRRGVGQQKVRMREWRQLYRFGWPIGAHRAHARADSTSHLCFL